MDEETSAAVPALPASPVPDFLDKERIGIALNASWEIEALADALLQEAASLPPGNLAIRGLSIRVRQLACLVMSALDDELENLPDLEERLTGQREEVSHG